MAVPNSLLVRCPACKIAATCPRKGSSPLVSAGGKPLLCKVVGGYSRDPISPDSLSEESKARAAKDGPCLTLVEVPTFDEDSGKSHFELVKVFHKPIRHPRETTTLFVDSMIERSHVREKAKR